MVQLDTGSNREPGGEQAATSRLLVKTPSWVILPERKGLYLRSLLALVTAEDLDLLKLESLSLCFTECKSFQAFSC